RDRSVPDLLRLLDPDRPDVVDRSRRDRLGEDPERRHRAAGRSRGKRQLRADVRVPLVEEKGAPLLVGVVAVEIVVAVVALFEADAGPVGARRAADLEAAGSAVRRARPRLAGPAVEAFVDRAVEIVVAVVARRPGGRALDGRAAAVVAAAVGAAGLAAGDPAAGHAGPRLADRAGEAIVGG